MMKRRSAKFGPSSGPISTWRVVPWPAPTASCFTLSACFTYMDPPRVLRARLSVMISGLSASLQQQALREHLEAVGRHLPVEAERAVRGQLLRRDQPAAPQRIEQGARAG